MTHCMTKVYITLRVTATQNMGVIFFLKIEVFDIKAYAKVYDTNCTTVRLPVS